MKKSKIDASGFLLVSIILFLTAGIVVAMFTLRSEPVEEALSDNRVINVLYVIEKDKKPLSSYVLMFYPATRRVAVFDIPGELGLLITRINRVARIDSIYDSGRIGFFEDEIRKLLGVDINFSIVINRENLGKLVDLLEGVEIFIPSPVNIRGDDELILFPSGMTILDGDKASLYATYVEEEEDQEMAVFRRQRFFLGFLKRQSLMNERLKNPEMAKLYYSFLKTDMKERTAARLFNEFASIDTERISIQSVGGNAREVSGQILLIPHWDGNLVKEIVRQTLGTLTRHTEDFSGERAFTVEVLNGTAISGLAGRTADLLRSFGYDVISIGNAGSSTIEKTEIVDRTGDEMSGRTFAGIIRCGNIRREFFAHDIPEIGPEINNLEYRSDFTLIIGRDFNGRYITGN